MTSYLSAVGLLLLCLTGNSYAQTTIIQPPTPEPIKINLAVDADSPVVLSVAERKASVLQFVRLEVFNITDRSIRAYVLIIVTEKGTRESIVIRAGKPLKAGASEPYSLGSQNILAKEGEQRISVDYVQFTDGSTWGENRADASKVITGYIDGVNLARKRLTDLLAETKSDPTDFDVALAHFGSMGIRGPFKSTHMQADSYRRRGYENVLKLLRSMAKRAPEAQELARKIELMQTPAPVR